MLSLTHFWLILFMLCTVIHSPGSFACPDGQSKSSLGICLPNIDVPNLPNIPGPIGSETDRFLKNLARELQKSPEAMQDCIENVSRCAQQIIAAPAAFPAQAYIDGLYRQSEGRTSSFPPEFIMLAKPYYDIDLSRVTYANDINTGSGMSLAYCDRVFFAGHPDLWRDYNDLHHVLHEIEHLVQCQKRGRQTFLAEYILRVGADIVRTGQLNVHDIHDFEVAANAKADDITDTIWNKIHVDCNNPRQRRNGIDCGQNQQILTTNIPTGLLSGTVMQNCGCWGFNPPMVSNEPRCQSGQVELRGCNQGCPTGGQAYGYLCR